MMRRPLLRMAATTATFVPCHKSLRLDSAVIDGQSDEKQKEKTPDEAKVRTPTCRNCGWLQYERRANGARGNIINNNNNNNNH